MSIKFSARVLQNVPPAVVAVVMTLVPFYAFLAVWGSTIVGHFTLLRLWPDVGLGLLVLITVAMLARDATSRRLLFSSLLFRLIVLFAILALGLGLAGWIDSSITGKAFAYGELVDLRFLVWFLCVWIVTGRSAWVQTHWRPLVFVPAVIVSLFAILQFFVLPANFLAHFGYHKTTTYVPYTTLNQNTTTIRPQSFTRGANELGAYLAIVITLIGLVSLKTKNRLKMVGLGIIVALALFLSFSRSAWIGVFLSLATLGYLWFRRYGKRLLIITAVCVLVLGGAVTALAFKSQSVRDAVLHANNNSTAQETSNEGHTAALKDSLHEIWRKPLGEGPGTAGPASWYNTAGNIRNSESFFLQLTEETGWAGVVLFVAILYALARILWRARTQPFAVALLALVVGAVAVNLLSYGWDDPTMAYVWWGLMAIGIAKLGQEKDISDATTT